MTNNINGFNFDPESVPATVKFIEMLRQSPFEVLDDFHIAVDGSITLVDPETRSAITLLIFESADNPDSDEHPNETGWTGR